MALTTLLHGNHQDPHAPPVRYEPFGPWLVPWEFSEFRREYDTLRAGVGLADYSICAFLECQGADRMGFLQRLLTNDLRGLAPGSSRPAALLNAQGKLVAEMLVIAAEHSLWLMCDVRQVDALEQALSHYLFSEHVNLFNYQRRFAMFGLQGSMMPDRLARLFPNAPKLPQPGAHAAFAWDSIPIWMLRHSPVGGDDPQMMLLVPADHAVKVWARLAKLIEPVGWKALNTIRLENGTPWLGIDYQESNLLSEAGLDGSLVSSTKGCYVGQEIVARIETYSSPARKLMWLDVDAAQGQTPQPGNQIMRGDEVVGQVTSSAKSIRYGHPIGFGFVKRGAYQPGTAVTILREMKRLPAILRDPAKLAELPDSAILKNPSLP